MADDQLNDQQLEELKQYFEALDKLRGIDRSGEWTDSELRELTSIYALIEKFGNGDPKTAALKHAKTIIGVNRAIELSAGDQSKSVH